MSTEANHHLFHANHGPYQTEFLELLNKAGDLAKFYGAKEFIAKLQLKRDHQIRFSNSQIDLNSIWDSYALELFLARGHRMNVITIQNPTATLLEELIPPAAKGLKTLPWSLLYWGMDRRKHPFYPEQEPNREMDGFMDQSSDRVKATINAALDAGCEKVAGVLYFGTTTTGLLTSYGNGGVYDGAYYRMTVRAFADAESSGQQIVAGKNLADIESKFTHAGRKAGEIANMARNGTQGQSGTYDLIMSPTVAANVLGQITDSASPIYFIGKMSCLTKSLKKQIGPESLTITDNPLLPEGLNSRPFDAEGTPCRETRIIDRGKLVNILQNTSSAKIWNLLGHFGSKSTGNSNLGSFIMDEYGPKLLAPVPSNTVVSPGDISLDEMIAESKRPTIYVTSNWYTRFTNNLEGTFSTIPRDGMFLIENGQITRPIRKLRLSDNLLRMLKHISAIGNDSQQILWWEVPTPTVIPSIKVDECTFTAASQ
jgi:PmbA protein